MGNPLFSPEERVDPPKDGLPEELKGKSAEEVARYYQGKQKELQDRYTALENQPPPAPRYEPPASPKPAEPAISSTEFWNNPVEATKRLIAQQGVGREEFERAGSIVQQNMIQTARLIAKDRFPDWARWEGEVMKIINASEAFQRANPTLWEMAYTHIKGLNVDKLVAEATAHARLPVEPVTPGGSLPVPKKDLTPAELRVAERLNMSPEAYLLAQERMDKGAWPQTLDNVRRK